MSTITYRYSKSEFTSSNGDVDYDRLESQVFALPIKEPIFIGASRGKSEIEFLEPLSESDKTLLDDLIATHSALEPVASPALQSKRNVIIDALINRALEHPELSQIPDVLSSYMASINPVVMIWIRDGNHTPLVTRISADAQSGEPYEGLLTSNVTDDETVSEYFVNAIPTTPYI